MLDRQFDASQLKFVRKAEINMNLSEFEIPPIWEVLLIGKKAPIGPAAAKQMVDVLSPEQYEVRSLEHPIFEALVIKKTIIKMLPFEKLLPAILEEGERIANENILLKIKLNINIQVNKEIDL
ncbi:MAG: hypothetical protein LRZ99_03745 [Desulfotomaculum sp.]|nr:hypothetical protein [Desulfotomaculum sp.]